MKTWRVRFTVDGKLTETIVKAISMDDAKKLVVSQYPMSKVSITSCVTI